VRGRGGAVFQLRRRALLIEMVLLFDIGAGPE